MRETVKRIANCPRRSFPAAVLSLVLTQFPRLAAGCRLLHRRDVAMQGSHRPGNGTSLPELATRARDRASLHPGCRHWPPIAPGRPC
jgi:hypothetical protein